MSKKYLSLVALFGATLLIGAGCNTTTTTETSVDGGSMLPTEESMNDGSMMEENNKGELVIEVEGENFSFAPNEIKVKKGDKVTINFKSASGFHDFVIDEFDVATKQVQTGEMSSVTFTADKVGSFEFYCSVGNHRAMGMVGTLVVEEGDAMMGTSLSGSEDAMVNDTDLSGEVNLDVDLSDDMIEKVGDNMMKDEDEKMEEDKMMKESAGTYEDYSASKLALANEGKVVLFFKANWCPTCNAVDKDIKANLSNVPSGTHILKVDYDNSTELKKKYGITYQHTFVQVDSSGNQIAKWAGSPTLKALVSNIK